MKKKPSSLFSCLYWSSELNSTEQFLLIKCVEAFFLKIPNSFQSWVCVPWCVHTQERLYSPIGDYTDPSQLLLIRSFCKSFCSPLRSCSPIQEIFHCLFSSPNNYVYGISGPNYRNPQPASGNYERGPQRKKSWALHWYVNESIINNLLFNFITSGSGMAGLGFQTTN